MAEDAALKVLLLQNVPNLGNVGETKNVSDGYALRNFLLPRGFATVVTEGALKQVATQKQVEQRKELKAQTKLSALSRSVLNATEVMFTAKVGEQHRLHGGDHLK